MANDMFSRRRLVTTIGVGAIGTAGAALLAACGETQVVTVEKIVTKEVPVETIVTKEIPVEKIVEKIITQEVVVEKVVEAPPQATPVAFEFISDHTSGPRAKAMKWALERYAQVRPNVTVIFTPNSGNIGDTIPIRIAAGTMSEMALLDGEFVFTFAPDGVFQPIDDLLVKNAEFNQDDYVFVADMWTANLDTEFPHLDEWRGPAYGLPYQMGNGGMWWNVDMFEAAGLEEPKEEWSYQGDLLQAIQQLTDPEAGNFGTLFRSGSDTFAWTHALFAFGAKQFVSPDGDKTTMFEDGGADGMQYIADLIHVHQAAPPVEAARDLAGEFGNLFLAGKAGIYFARTGNVAGSVTSIRDRFLWSQAPMPTSEITGTFNVFRQNQPHLVTDSAFKRGNVETVVDFGVFMAGPEVQGRAAIDRGFTVSRWDVLDLEATLAPPPLNMAMMGKMLREAEWRNWPKWHPAWSEWKDFRSFIHKAFVGEQSVPEAIASTVQFADDTLVRNAEDMQKRFDFFGRTDWP
jgi:ABC-type glycerol-3-phosphate transport system substrate-binding protein